MLRKVGRFLTTIAGLIGFATGVIALYQFLYEDQLPVVAEHSTVPDPLDFCKSSPELDGLLRELMSHPGEIVVIAEYLTIPGDLGGFVNMVDLAYRIRNSDWAVEIAECDFVVSSYAHNGIEYLAFSEREETFFPVSGRGRALTVLLPLNNLDGALYPLVPTHRTSAMPLPLEGSVLVSMDSYDDEAVMEIRPYDIAGSGFKDEYLCTLKKIEASGWRSFLPCGLLPNPKSNQPTVFRKDEGVAIFPPTP